MNFIFTYYVTVFPWPLFGFSHRFPLRIVFSIVYCVLLLLLLLMLCSCVLTLAAIE